LGNGASSSGVKRQERESDDLPSYILPMLRISGVIPQLLPILISPLGKGIVLRAGRSGIRVPVGARDFSLSQNVHPVSCSVGTGVLCRGKTARTGSEPLTSI